MKKIIRYRLSVSVRFPATHPKKGEGTDFVGKIQLAIGCFDCGDTNCSVCSRYINLEKKIHTIRANYTLWQKRFEKINKGEAVLELYYWSGKPYNSKCVTICQLSKDDGIGLQKIKMVDHGNFTYSQICNYNSKPHIHSDCVDYNEMKSEFFLENRIAKNDGLTYNDFKAWFKNYDLSEPMAIIHFTNFRYPKLF